MSFNPYYSVSQLIEIKFILSKFGHITFDCDMNITHVMKLWSRYVNYLKDNEDEDIDYPGYKFKFNKD
jgi:hypothetical protein